MAWVASRHRSPATAKPPVARPQRQAMPRGARRPIDAALGRRGRQRATRACGRASIRVSGIRPMPEFGELVKPPHKHREPPSGLPRSAVPRPKATGEATVGLYRSGQN